VVKLGNQKDLIYLLGLRLEDPGVVTLDVRVFATNYTAAGLPPLVDFDLERRVSCLPPEFVRLGAFSSRLR